MPLFKQKSHLAYWLLSGIKQFKVWAKIDHWNINRLLFG